MEIIRKRRLKTCIAALVLVAAVGFSIFSLAGCTRFKMSVSKMTETLALENLADRATIRTNAGGDSFPYTDSDYGSVDINFSKETAFNAVALSEKSSSVEDFEILVCSGKRWSKIYRQDFIREFRYCVFPKVTASSVKIRFTSGSGEFTVSDVGIYDVPAAERDFHTVSYLTVDSFLDFETFRTEQGAESFSGVTDVILFGGAEFRSDGTLDISPNLDIALSNLKMVENALGVRFQIYCNFLNSGKEMEQGKFETRSDLYVAAMKNNREAFQENLKSFLEGSAFDGVAFDWEYPSRNSDWKVYSDFLTRLSDVLQGRKIACAVTGWGTSLTKSAVEAVELFLIMSYDLPDDTGSHASFDLAWKDVAKLESIGFPRRKLCMGIPFYARETEGQPLWFNYVSEAADLGRENNSIRNPITFADGSVYAGNRFYNGYLMVRDKTAFAYDSGMGGVMFWNHTTDSAYDLKVNGQYVSLLRASAEAISFRTK